MKEFSDDECAMLRPLMEHFVAVSDLRLSWLHELYNFPTWVVQTPERWLNLLERMQREQLVIFKRDSEFHEASSTNLANALSRPCPTVDSAKAARKRDQSKKLYVGFTETGGKFWECCTAIDWNEFFSIKVSEQTRNVFVELCSSNAVTSFEQFRLLGPRPWKGRIVADAASTHFVSPVYWRTFRNPWQLTYELDTTEMEHFIQAFRWRSRIPSGPAFR